jgi:aldehyde:ferredoxin oxidoreductase
MNPNYKRILYINLADKTYEYKMHKDINEYIGGVAIAYKLFLDNLDLDPIILSTGPLSGYFPYVSKACLVYRFDNKFNELYGGGNISALLNYAEIDAVLLHGITNENLQIDIFQDEIQINNIEDDLIQKNISNFELRKNGIFSNGYFSFGNVNDIFGKTGGAIKINVNFTKSNEYNDYYEYEKLYNTALDNYKSLSVEPANNPSCFGCPMGCENSLEGEEDLNIGILPRCLVACGFSEQIYKNIPFVYSCLSSVGYLYQHEQLEDISDKVGLLKKDLNEILNS